MIPDTQLYLCSETQEATDSFISILRLLTGNFNLFYIVLHIVYYTHISSSIISFLIFGAWFVYIFVIVIELKKVRKFFIVNLVRMK